MKMTSLIFALGAALTVTTLPADASLNDFQGQWQNVDGSTGSLTRIVIKRTGTVLRVNPFGKCHPTDCNWGNRIGRPFAPSVSQNLVTSARRAIALFSPSHARTTLVLTLVNNSTLRFCTYTHFVDGSNRSDYYACGTMRKTRFRLKRAMRLRR